MHAVGGCRSCAASGWRMLPMFRGDDTRRFARHPGCFRSAPARCPTTQGQKAAAAHLSSLLQDSEIRESHRKNDPRIQDAYSVRCMPQVHGAVRDVLAHCEQILSIESASATDNPLVFPDSGDVVSGGNFHGARSRLLSTTPRSRLPI